MPTTEKAGDVRRTRLSAEREAELYGAVVELLREVGYEALTMPAVAARSRSSTATLYRQWGGKPGLVLAALKHHQPPPDVLDVDTGSLRGDLREITIRVTSDAPAEHELMAGLSHAALGDPQLAQTMREQLAVPAQEALGRVLRRAADRGEIPADGPAQAYCAHLLIAVSVIIPVMEGRPVDQGYALDFLDAVMIPALRRPASSG
ncbi:TetR/AcrR family transcriptional regulator [Nonomuraea guangzhouensis]|uniref:TetR/AcrR family transcriptional regulator n=1 Tax=Nonomuraea guangzhouensis TaxID=1291555 RepID=A0ABW4G7T4_9ACTN|nr:TetR/AcrR family transcriptional regulator [Nonomuraea guangzhouensis]